MGYANTILDTIGDTPLVRLNKVLGGDFPALVLAKVEFFNPGNSVKDRMAVKMVEDAEKDGRLKPGGTIIEGTSGNTGMGLALVSIVKGYRCIFVTNDKQSKEKCDMLRAVGAEVVVCPTDVKPTDPRSYYSVSKRLAKETPNSWYVNQYDNLSNRQAHYEHTAPEIWKQTRGKLTHFVVGAGTGGTITGCARFFKEKNTSIQIIGVDTYGSILKEFHETGRLYYDHAYPYITEGIGEDIIPENYDMSVIDHFEKVTDKDGAIYARKLAREEGIFCGYSAGSAISALVQMKDRFSEKDIIVVLLHDHGSRYIAKIYNDDWMRAQGWL
ncbi:MAG: pyridoxal-phosphate dependent enzyme [Bergeyella sp.]|nr:pyridoxal-phosphate dependent enzyme [Bergeyella sp.]